MTLTSWLFQHCSPSNFRVNLPGLQPSSIEIWVLQPTTLQNKVPQISFLGIFRAAARPHNFLSAAFLIFVMNLLKDKRKKTGAFWEFNVCSWITSEFSSCFHCFIMFWTCQQFRISHFTYHLRYYQLGIIWQLIIGEAVNKSFTSYIRLCNYVILNSNEQIKVAHLQKLANQSVLNGALW